jgi:NAD(P)H dehydrogenase (quinone)
MTTVAVVYHSGYGHTHVVAEAVAEGVRRAGAEAKLLRIENAAQDFAGMLEEAGKADAIIFGTPVYMGDVSAPLKAFFEASSKVWMAQGWAGKVAAGFANGLTPGGNKDNALGSIFVLAMQHSMIWVGTGLMPGNMEANAKAAPEALNRLSYSIGVGTQSDNAGPDVTPTSGDKDTARHLGERVAKVAAKLAA